MVEPVRSSAADKSCCGCSGVHLGSKSVLLAAGWSSVAPRRCSHSNICVGKCCKTNGFSTKASDDDENDEGEDEDAADSPQAAAPHHKEFQEKYNGPV